MKMIEHPNSLLLHHCLQAANAGDRQTLRALWSDDIVWNVKAGPWQGEFKGPDQIFEYLADLGDFGNTGVQTEVEDVMVSHRRAAMICRSQVARGERELDARFVVIATIEDRRIHRMTSIPIDGNQVDAFMAGDAA